MAELPPGISESEKLRIFGRGAKGARRMSYRLSKEGCRIIQSEAKRMGLDRTKALEFILLETRERRKGRGR